MATLRNRAPAWFWVVAVLILLWGAAGVAAFYLDVNTTPGQLAEMSAYDQKLLASRPTWFLWLYGVAVWSGLIGGIVLLLRSSLAQAAFVLSLVTVVAMFGYFFAVTDIVAVKGFVASAGFPIVIAALAVFQVWFAGYARRRGWIA